jgi:hypothetical protein
MTEVWHLLQPATVYQEPALIERVKTELAAVIKAQTAA